jgi:hypothetical protein
MLLVASTAQGYTTGIALYSGEQMKVCTECHAPGPILPKATLSGPASLAAGETGTFTLLIDTDVTTSATQVAQPRQAGLDVAASAGTLGTVNQINQTRLIDGELSHTNALAAAKTVQVQFTLTAPAEGGTVTLYAAALSANGDGTNAGDGTDATTLQVQVIAPPPPDLASPPDLAGVDLAGVVEAPDLAAPLDLATVDAVSSATGPRPAPPTPKVPPHDEPRWDCGSVVGGRPAAGAGALLLLLAAAALARRKSFQRIARSRH